MGRSRPALGVGEIVEQFGRDALRIMLAAVAAFALLDLAFSVFGQDRPGQVVVGVVTSVTWVASLVWFDAAARLLRRPGRVAVAVAVVSAVVAASGTWNSPYTNEVFALMGVSTVVASRRGVALCVLIACGGHVGGLLLQGITPKELFDSHHLAAVANVVGDFVLFAVVLLLAVGACRGILERARESLDAVRAGGATLTPALGVALRRADGGPVAMLPAARPVDVTAVLNGQELDLVRQLASGLLPKQVARETGTPMGTVRSRIASAKRKTGARTVEQLVGLVAEADLPCD